ncbi:MAG TPA: hypothetical protein VK993_02245 [Chthoniobacterales bacterium]|nr:hypothetical protein [Chthoniobacterales bacterium]
MKTKSLLTIFAALAALQLAPLASAQDGDPADHPRRARYTRMLANLSPDERAKLRAAHRQAMADPAVQAAKDRQIAAARQFRELKRSRMLQADPTLQPILDKMPARGRRGR